MDSFRNLTPAHHSANRNVLLFHFSAISLQQFKHGPVPILRFRVNMRLILHERNSLVDQWLYQLQYNRRLRSSRLYRQIMLLFVIGIATDVDSKFATSVFIHHSLQNLN